MAPKLRSSSRSTPTTPIGQSSRSTTPSSTPGRKVPHCKTCRKPRAGHPRSGCPPVDNSASPEASEGETTQTEDDNIVTALGSIRLNTLATAGHDREEESKHGIRERRRTPSRQGNLAATMTLESMSTQSNHQEKPHAKIVRWQETLQCIEPPIPMKSRQPRTNIMPGSLFAPSPESSFNSLASISGVEPPVASTSRPSSQPKPLARTMSAIEREDFVSFVTSKSSTAIYTVPKADIQSITEEASKHRFHAETVMYDGDEEAFLVMGRDQSAVQRVASSIATQERLRILDERELALRLKEKKLEEQMVDVAKGASAFRAAAGGAVVGAVGAFAGLAFT